MQEAGDIAVPGIFHDGRTATSHRVSIGLSRGVVSIRGDGIDRDVPLAGIRVSERLGAAPRMLHLPDGTSVVLASNADARLFEGGRFRWSDLLAHIESRWTAVLVSLMVMLGALAAAYAWVLPAVADAIAERLPAQAAAAAGDQTLAMLEKNFLETSRLPPSRSTALLDRLARMQQPQPAQAYHVIFRDSPKLGANAFALPNATIVVTDNLVELARSDDEVLAVVGHEMGHVQRRHLLRQILRGSVLTLFMTWWTGDFGSTALMLSTAFLEMGYSRDFEREADDYAAAFLRANGLSPILLGNMLEQLEANRKGAAPPAYLSTHPGTRERIERLRIGVEKQPG